MNRLALEVVMVEEKRTELFALKLPKNEKDAMNFIADERGKTLTKVFYKTIQQTIYEQLGLVLLDKLSRPRVEVKRKDGQEAGRVPSYIKRNAPNVVVDFVHIMDIKEKKKNFHSIFEDLQFTEKEWLLYEIDITKLAKHMGKEYLDLEGSFEPPDLEMAKSIFFEYMIHMTYQLTAIGLLKTLDDEWQKNQARIERFKDELIAEYEQTFEDALEVVEVVEVDERGRGRR
jgi:hypothetical protein